MSDNNAALGEDDEDIGQPAEPQPLYEEVTVDDFASVDLNALTGSMARLDRHALVDLFWSKIKDAADGGDARAERVYRLVSALVGLHLRVESEGDPFGLQWQNGTRRTAIPHDFRGDQGEVLADLAPSIVHPTLRARFADVAYETGVRRAGRTAVDAYCEVARRIADGSAALEFPDIGTRAMDCLKPLERSFMINARIAKRGTLVEPIAETLRLAFDNAISERAYFPLAQLGRRVLQHKLIPAEEVAETAARLASTAPPEDYDMAVKECWNLATDAYDRAGDGDASRDAAIKSIERTLAMADTVRSSSAKAHWVKQALREFRARGDAKDRVDEMRRRLRELQDKALDEFSGIPFKLDGIEEVRDQTYEQFKALGLTDTLRSMAGFSKPDDVEKLKESVLQQARDFPLSNLFATSYADHEGREVARGPSLDFDDQPSEAWYKEHGIRHMSIVRRFRVHGNIEPARQAVLERFSINEQHMLPIVQMSSFILAGHHHIFSVGFARLWQGDYATAGHLLLPQIENSLRHILQMSGRDSAKMEEDGIEGDRPLNILLGYCRADLEAILGVDMVWELDSLLNFRPGPALRHELAHGKMGWNAFFSDEAISACLNQDSRAPTLLVEAKAWDKPFVRAAKASLRASEKQLIIEAIRHLNIGGTKAKSPVVGDWHDHLDQVRGYVQASKTNYDHEIPCAVLASGQWIVIFSAPAATFIEDKINGEHLLIFKGDEILEGAERLYRLLSRRRLGCVAPPHIRPAQIDNHMSAATVAAAYHAVLISYETTGAKFFAKVPLILVYPAILLRRDDGTLFTVLDGQNALPMDVDRADANGQSLLDSHLADVEAQAQALLQACSQCLGGELAAADLADFPGFDAIPDNGGSAGITAPRAAYVRPTRGAHDDWLIATGDRTHYLRLRPAVACRFHAWSECRTVGQQIGNGAIGTAKTDTPRAFFVDGSPYHCAHQTISDRRAARCHIAPLDGRTCCQACNLQAVCWTGGELAQLPCGG